MLSDLGATIFGRSISITDPWWSQEEQLESSVGNNPPFTPSSSTRSTRSTLHSAARLRIFLGFTETLWGSHSAYQRRTKTQWRCAIWSQCAWQHVRTMRNGRWRRWTHLSEGFCGKDRVYSLVSDPKKASWMNVHVHQPRRIMQESLMMWWADLMISICVSQLKIGLIMSCGMRLCLHSPGHDWRSQGSLPTCNEIWSTKCHLSELSWKMHIS